MIKIVRLSSVNEHYSTAGSRAATLGHAASEYFEACALANEHQRDERGVPFFCFLLPTMHQTIELVSKAIASKAIVAFDPKKYSHRTESLMRDCAASVSVFEEVLNEPANVELLRDLEKAYFGVRYGECAVSYDGQAWSQFESVSGALFDDLSRRTNLRFTLSHRLE